MRSNDNAEGHDFSELLLGELKTEKQPEDIDESNLEVKNDRSLINEANSNTRNGTKSNTFHEIFLGERKLF